MAIEDSYYFGERMFFDEKNRRIVFPVNNFSVRYDGPFRNFYAWHVYTPDGKHCVRLGDYEKNRQGGSKTRLSAFYSKHELLEGLMKGALESGVKVFPGISVISHRRAGGVNEIRTAEGKIFRGTFTNAADGIN